MQPSCIPPTVWYKDVRWCVTGLLLHSPVLFLLRVTLLNIILKGQFFQYCKCHLNELGRLSFNKVARAGAVKHTHGHESGKNENVSSDYLIVYSTKFWFTLGSCGAVAS